MPTNDEATPRPWRVCQYKHETYVGSNDGVSLWNSDGALYRIADGVLIVRAVNAHDGLVDCVEACHAWITTKMYPPLNSHETAMVELMQAALAAAKETP